MSKLQNDETSRKTLELNFEVNLFNERLKSHLEISTVDLQLLSQLQKTTELISSLMSDCNLIDKDTTDVSQNINEFQIYRQLQCRLCGLAIKTDVFRVQEHLCSDHHQRAAAKKENKTKKTIGNVTQIFTNSNLTNTDENLQFHMKPVLVNSLPKVVNRPEPTIKLSKKVTAFLRDQNLEKSARKFYEEGERIKISTKHFVVVESIEKALRSKYPNVKVYPFGSRFSGLGSENSDLDLFVDLDNHYFKTANTITSSEFRYIEMELRKTKMWIDFFPITAARTPILQAVFQPDNIPCDLSFSNGLSHCNSKLISCLVNLQPIFAKISIIVKKWAEAADIKMNSYAVTLLVVFYFQQCKLLPTVHALQDEELGEVISIGHWQAHTGSIVWTETSNDFRHHLINFFNYYGRFDFQTYIVCPYLGIPIKKECFLYGREKLPAELHTYLSYMKKIDLLKAENLTDLFAYEKPMVIQDPFEMIHNVSKGVKPASCERFISYCNLTADYLKMKRIL